MTRFDVDLGDEGIRDAEEFFREYYRDEAIELLDNYSVDNRSLEIDAEYLENHAPENIAKFLRSRIPERAIAYLEEGLLEFEPEFRDSDVGNPRVRPVNLADSRAVRDLHTGLEGKLVSVRATVDKIVSAVEELEMGVFECNRCGAERIEVPQTGAGSDLKEPAECPKCERNGPFSLQTRHSKLRPYQKVRLSELPEDRNEAGSKGAQIVVHLRDDLIDSVSPGDRIEANGIVRMSQVEDRAEFEPELDIVSIEHEQSDLSNIEITREDEERILDIAQEGNVLERVRDSIAPSIYGLEAEKEAIALQLLSGVSGETSRGQMHILLVGDPGTGKSKLLSSAAEIHPRSVKTSGEGSTGTGLTAAAVQDEFGDGSWTVEAGALPSAHKGLAAVDELDKMQDDDRAHLNSALADGVVSVAKAGISAELPAEASLLSAANPKYGRFDQYENIADQIELQPSLISRFDLIFTVEDEVDEDLDHKRMDKILSTSYVETMRQRGGDPGEYAEEANPEIDHDILRKYLAYASQEVVPVLDPDSEASELLRDFFDEVRQQATDPDVVPITLRKFASLQRLAEASARMRLSEQVEEVDAERAIRIVHKTLMDVSYDPETGQIDADIVETGQSTSQRDRMKTLRDIIQEISDGRDDGKAPREDILDAAEDHGMERERAKDEIQTLASNGEIMEPAHGYFRVI